MGRDDGSLDKGHWGRRGEKMVKKNLLKVEPSELGDGWNVREKRIQGWQHCWKCQEFKYNAGMFSALK